MDHGRLRPAARAEKTSAWQRRWLLGMALLVLAPVAQAQLAQALVVANQGRTISKALADGKAVLVARKTVFNPATDIGELPSIRGGGYRPPLTYWQHRDSKAPLVLGGYSTEEGRGKLLTGEYHFFILEPGMYDLVGYVRKTRRVSTLAKLAPAQGPIRSSLGFVNFSRSTLPALQAYTAWVPPSAAGTTFDGHTLTQWYDPGYYEGRARTVADDAVLVDMRGLVPNAPDGEANVASFFAQPGQFAVVGDFQLEFTHGACDAPAQDQWVCPLDSLSLALPFSPQEDDAREAMAAVGYKAKLVEQVGTALLVPGQFFAGQQMTRAPDLRTTRGAPYALFTARSSVVPGGTAAAGRP